MSARSVELRDAVRKARLYLIFTPEVCGAREPLAVLEAVLDHVDIVQVRPKAPDRNAEPARGDHARIQTNARELFDWCSRVLDVVKSRSSSVLVIANDRVDVARSLQDRGLAGVHLGQDDCPVDIARAVLGDDALIGFSTHTHGQVAEASELAVDYLGFGPIFETATKGYARGLGAEAAWIAQQGTELPLFPIGGIGRENVVELAEVGRAAVSSAILAAPDPARAAQELRAWLDGV
ncbi:MAG: thiamine phosphate synthase [Planctomycetes bacterium]|nr:thiamine phosphate synthase [Planctomycetota bacterium]